MCSVWVKFKNKNLHLNNYVKEYKKQLTNITSGVIKLQQILIKTGGGRPNINSISRLKFTVPEKKR